jgi:hypothetical protein
VPCHRGDLSGEQFQADRACHRTGPGLVLVAGTGSDAHTNYVHLTRALVFGRLKSTRPSTRPDASTITAPG